MRPAPHVWGRVLQCDNGVTQAEYGSTASGQRLREQTRISPELQPATDRKFRESLLSESDRFFCPPDTKTQESSLCQFAFRPACAETGRSS